MPDQIEVTKVIDGALLGSSNDEVGVTKVVCSALLGKDRIEVTKVTGAALLGRYWTLHEPVIFIST